MNPRDFFGTLSTQTRYANQLNSMYYTQWNHKNINSMSSGPETCKITDFNTQKNETEIGTSDKSTKTSLGLKSSPKYNKTITSPI